MKLKKYLEKENKTVADMSRDLNIVHSVILRWANGERTPSSENMAKIVAYTKGEVTANDFYGIEEKSE